MSDSNLHITTAEGYCIELSKLLLRYKELFNEIESQLNSFELSESQMNLIADKVAIRMCETVRAKEIIQECINNSDFFDRVCDTFKAKMTTQMLWQDTYKQFINDLVDTDFVKHYLDSRIDSTCNNAFARIDENVERLIKNSVQEVVDAFGRNLSSYKVH